MDFIETQRQIEKLGQKLLALAEEYRAKRTAYGKARSRLILHLIPMQNNPKYQKAALERQYIMLLQDAKDEDRQKVQKIYREMIESHEEYKGLEQLIDAHKARLSSLQSLMKWEHQSTSTL